MACKENTSICLNTIIPPGRAFAAGKWAKCMNILFSTCDCHHNYILGQLVIHACRVNYTPPLTYSMFAFFPLGAVTGISTGCVIIVIAATSILLCIYFYCKLNPNRAGRKSKSVMEIVPPLTPSVAGQRSNNINGSRQFCQHINTKIMHAHDWKDTSIRDEPCVFIS